MTCYLDWRAEPETDVAEEVISYIRPAAMCQDGKAKYRIQCFADGCNWEEFFPCDQYTDDEIEEERSRHIDWHREGCPD